jgi:Translin-associated factor X-interacting N-terminus
MMMSFQCAKAVLAVCRQKFKNLVTAILTAQTGRKRLAIVMCQMGTEGASAATLSLLASLQLSQQQQQHQQQQLTASVAQEELSKRLPQRPATTGSSRRVVKRPQQRLEAQPTEAVVHQNYSLHDLGDARWIASHDGDLDAWPATSLNAKVRNASRSVRVLDSPIADLMCSSKVAPRLLQRLLAYVSTQLTQRNCAAVVTQDGSTVSNDSGPLRLQVYREAFGMFTEEFATYRSFLGQVRAAYDGVLSEYETQLRAATQMKHAIR